MEDAVYREENPLLPRNLTYILASVLIVAVIAMPISGAEMWMTAASALIFAVAIVFCLIAKLRVDVYPDRMEVAHLFRTRIYGRDEMLEKRCGELADIRSYSNWDLKGVKRLNYARIGEDSGVAIKVRGMRIVTISSQDPESLLASIPTADKEDEQHA